MSSDLNVILRDCWRDFRETFRQLIGGGFAKFVDMMAVIAVGLTVIALLASFGRAFDRSSIADIFNRTGLIYFATGFSSIVVITFVFYAGIRFLRGRERQASASLKSTVAEAYVKALRQSTLNPGRTSNG